MTSSVITAFKEREEVKIIAETTETTSQINLNDNIKVTEIHSEVITASKEATKTVTEEVKDEKKLGELPPPVELEKSKLPETQAKENTSAQKPDDQDRNLSDEKADPISGWGKPLGLPSPIRPSTPAKHSRKNEEQSVDSNKSKASIEPVWMDLAYVPHHGNKNYADAEYFKRVRARYYVFSGVEPSKEVFNALLEAKKTWENKDQEVTIIPTYDTDVLGYWVAENEDLLTELKIDLAPSASRCTINLQDHETSCAAYRLEF